MKKTRLLLTAAIMCAFPPFISEFTSKAEAFQKAQSTYDDECPVALIEEYEAEQTSAVDLSQLTVQDTFVHGNFLSEFPDVVSSQMKDGLSVSTCRGEGYLLGSIVCPIGLQEMGAELMASELDAQIDLGSSRKTIIGGLELTVYDATPLRAANQLGKGVLYALNSGEETYIFLQLSKIPSDWWVNHISWNFDGKTSKSPSQLLEALNDFMQHMNEINQIDVTIKEDPNDNAIRVSFFEDESTLEKDKAANSLFSMLKSFSVFNAFADLKYDFVMEQIDSEGNRKIGYTFPHSAYSKWSDYNQLLKYLDEEQPEGTMERSHRAIGG